MVSTQFLRGGRFRFCFVCSLGSGLLCSISLSYAQPTPSPAAIARRAADADRKKSETEPLSATVIEVSGTVEWAKAGVSPLADKGWSPVRWKDRLAPKTQIRTGLRSFVHLQFGKTTVVSLRSATHASLDQLQRTATTERVRIGLGYGTVRGGSIEGTLRSDVVIDSTVATLAKRGTEGWQMSVEPMTGRFRISLAEYGLVEAIRKVQGARRSTRTVRPGEYATDANIANMWIKQDIFDRSIQFFEADAVSLAEADFNTENTSGISVVAPGAGSTLSGTTGRSSASFVLDQVKENFGGVLPPTTVIVPIGPPAVGEGNFGTPNSFRVLVPGPSMRGLVSAGIRSSIQRRINKRHR